MAIEKVELKDALNALVTNTNIDKVTGVLGGVPSNISKADLASVMAGVIGNANANKGGLMSDSQFRAIFGGKGENGNNVGKFMRFDMVNTRASVVLQISQNSVGTAGLYSLVVNGYDAPKLKVLNTSAGNSTIEFFYKRDSSSLKTSILIKCSRDYSTVYATTPEEIRYIGLEDSSSGYSSLIPKEDVFGYNTLADLSSAVAGQMGIYRITKVLASQEELSLPSYLGFLVLSTTSGGYSAAFLLSAYNIFKVGEAMPSLSSQFELTVSGMVCRIKNISNDARSVELLCIGYKGI